MADELIDADTMARLSAMMRRAPAGQSSIPGMEPAPPFVMPEVSSMIGPDIYNREFPDYIGNPPPTELPPVYNTEFSDLVGRPPARGYVSSLPPRASALPSFRTEHLPPPELYSNWDERPDPRLERISSRGGAYDWQPSGNVSPPGAAPDPGRAARVEQLIRELEEQQALEARLRAMGR